MHIFFIIEIINVLISPSHHINIFFFIFISEEKFPELLKLLISVEKLGFFWSSTNLFVLNFVCFVYLFKRKIISIGLWTRPPRRPINIFSRETSYDLHFRSTFSSSEILLNYIYTYIFLMLSLHFFLLTKTDKIEHLYFFFNCQKTKTK